MKKIMVMILLGLTCLTMYFVVLWEPSIVKTFNKETSEQKEEIIKDKNESKENDKNDRKEKELAKEQEKNKEEEEVKRRKEIEEQEKIQKEKNKENLLEFKNNLKEEDRKIIDKKIGVLSTVDLMKVEAFLSRGELKEAKELMKLRMLEADWRLLYEIFGEYKK